MKAIVLCSGGLDSTVLLYKIVKEEGADNVIALNIFYGQRHHKEKEFALWQAQHLGVLLLEADLSEVFKFNKDSSSLLEGSNKAIEHRSYQEQLESLGGSGTVSTYVPYRNGLFLSYATAVALQFNCSYIYYGAHADDSVGNAYPDCTKDFILAQGRAIYYGTGKTVFMSAPWWNFNKATIVAKGLELGMAHEELEHTWSCYEGKDIPCGTCGTCIDRKKAFEANGIFDIM